MPSGSSKREGIISWGPRALFRRMNDLGVYLFQKSWSRSMSSAAPEAKAQVVKTDPLLNESIFPMLRG
jgi:hypothetical protein